MCFGDSRTDTLSKMLQSLIPSEISKRETALGPLQKFAMSRLTGGLPEFSALKDFSSGPVATQTGLARNQILRSQRTAGMSPSDPASQGVLGDFEASRARGYDQNMIDLINANEAAKQKGAAQLSAIGATRSPYPALSLFRDVALNG